MMDTTTRPGRTHQAAIIEAAVAYAERGWWVFPAPPDGRKQGLRSAKDNGVNWGSVRTVEEVRAVFGVEYLRKRFRLSRCNVGICTGAESGIVVLDVDTKAGHDRDGLASLRALEERYGRLPRTLTAITPSGGLQMFYQHPGDVYIPGSASEIGDGIDVKADGGMVIAPPSWRNGRGYYQWNEQRGNKIAAMPGWLIAPLVTREARRGARGPKNFFEQFADLELCKASVAELTIAVSLIPNRDVDWESWNRMGMALHAATGGSGDGLRLFDAWSRKSAKYDPAATAEKWGKLDGCPPMEISTGSIFFMAEEAVPCWRERLRERKVVKMIDAFLVLMGGEQ
jgi:hypothetical protein